MKRKFFRTFALLLLSSLMIFGCMLDASAYAAPSNARADKLLFVTDKQGISELSAFNEAGPVSAYVDYANYEAPDFDAKDIAAYRAVAFPCCEDLREEIRTAYNSGCIVYLYGELTIQDYKAATGLEAYALDVNLYSEQEDNREKVSQFFDSVYEENEVFHVISYSPMRCCVKSPGIRGKVIPRGRPAIICFPSKKIFCSQ